MLAVSVSETRNFTTSRTGWQPVILLVPARSRPLAMASGGPLAMDPAVLLAMAHRGPLAMAPDAFLAIVLAGNLAMNLHRGHLATMSGDRLPIALLHL
jgi:hypothetical protein